LREQELRKVHVGVAAALVGLALLPFAYRSYLPPYLGGPTIPDEPPAPPVPTADKSPPPPPGSYPTEPLDPGTVVPPVVAAGWLNAPAPLPNQTGGRFTVLVIWANW
jgi:hypothetical protein